MCMLILTDISVCVILCAHIYTESSRQQRQVAPLFLLVASTHACSTVHLKPEVGTLVLLGQEIEAIVVIL